jgi:hypothetical protein
MTETGLTTFLTQNTGGDHYLLWSFFGLLLIIALLITAWVYNRMIIRRQGIRIQRLQNELNWDREKIEQLANRVETAFADNLSHASIAMRFQKPRLNTGDIQRSQAPERYGYLRGLLAKNMSLEEIAELLTISRREAEQLIKLAQLGQPAESV